MKSRIYFFAILSITLALAYNAAAQAPVLFDGTNPVPLNFQSEEGQGVLPSDDAIPRSQLITPEELSKTLRSGKQKPLVLQVGPHTVYAQAHIPGAEYIGATSGDEGKQKLRDRVKALPKNSAVVLYCGCCPWGRCPNIHLAYQLLHSLGFTNVKVLYIADNFGADWVSKGYPVAKGD
ncbi:MAG TPA: rhodanese-like domain-containing protein [Terriglobales bacterium]